MGEYNLEFAEAMAEASNLILHSESLHEEGQRAALYTALVACEIALKYALSEAGVTVPKTHDLSKLMGLVSDCSIEDVDSNGAIKRVPASRIRGVSASDNYSDATLGNLLEAEEFGASKFPNEIRYGRTLEHFPASVMQQASLKLIAWVKCYAPSIQA
ncbi:HEPN domain-containing protein [Thioalkalivibrio sp. ALJ24]|uniref:HEPN domain-containing protein n=1 Tax=Thioalkalivibrio sp. ALJ24 TaxID=545276 RepID=UPI000A06106B|nr:HEPN domain-containing protein [Thioalkalivibrio sp. ALJ24]